VDRPDNPAHARGAGRGDGGFTLVEVTVSLILLAVILAAALSLFVRAMANTDLQAQRGQAITIANDQLEQVRGLPVADMVRGRTLASVQDLWTWDTSPTGPTALSVMASDGTATTASTPVIPTIRTQRVDNVDFVVRTYIDTCYLPNTGSTTCGRTSASAEAMYRITVSVAWSPRGERKCDATTTKVVTGKSNCQEYIATTLRDPSSEATFNTN
jgi:prepilin-type N-terminal cleavage/methylation domain-containing protein